MMMKKQITTNQDGATLLEFAIIIPVLFALIFGIIEFSLLLYNKHIITNAAREGARLGVIIRDPSIGRVSEDEIRTEVKKYARSHLITFGSNTLEDGDIKIIRGSLAFGNELTVKVYYYYNYLFFSNSPTKMRVTSRMRME